MVALMAEYDAGDRVVVGILRGVYRGVAEIDLRDAFIRQKAM